MERRSQYESPSGQVVTGGARAHLVRVALALRGAAEVVDHDAGTARGKKEGVHLAETTASASDNDDLTVVSQLLGHDDVCERSLGREARGDCEWGMEGGEGMKGKDGRGEK